MKNRIQSVTDLGGVPKELRLEHNEFTQWESFSSTRDHDTILCVRNWSRLTFIHFLIKISCQAPSTTSIHN